MTAGKPALGQERSKAAAVSLLFNLGSLVIKIVAAVLTGSVAILSEAAHSATDVVASGLAFFSVRAAAVPPDEEHPYGHGKMESLAGFGESLLLFVAVAYVGYESILRLVHGVRVESLDVGIVVMALSSVGSLLTARYVKRVARSSESLALLSNGQHLMVDFWTSVGVLGGLLIAHLTGYHQADAVLALALCVWLGVGALRLSRQAFDQLVDRRLESSEIDQIERILKEEPRIVSYHRLRTRRSGRDRYIDLHIVVPRDWSLVEAHRVADDLEKRLQAHIAHSHVVIHVDPFDPQKARRSSDGA